MTRIDWDELWMGVADLTARRSKCVRGQNGAVIVDATNRLVATGYNGPPALYLPAAIDCTVAMCERAEKTEPPPDYHDCISIHAESNALLFCDRRDREGGTIYVTGPSCWDCGKLIANSGVTRYVAKLEGFAYRDWERTAGFMWRSGLTVVDFSGG